MAGLSVALVAGRAWCVSLLDRGPCSCRLGTLGLLGRGCRRMRGRMGGLRGVADRGGWALGGESDFGACCGERRR